MDLRIVARAKEYIDALANGIDPLTEEPLPEDDVVNQARIARCLIAVSEVLGMVLHNGGVQVRRVERECFTPEKLDYTSFSYSETPIPISEFICRVNACCPENMRRINRNGIVDWLVDHQYLKRVVINDFERLQLGEKSSEIGIQLRKRCLKDGVVSFPVYTKNAQLFLLAHLADIYSNHILFDSEKKKEWTHEETLYVDYAWKSGLDISVIARQLQRSKYDVRRQIEELIKKQLPKNTYPKGQKEPLDTLSRILQALEQSK